MVSDVFYRVKKFLPWIHHHTNKAKIYKVQELKSVQQVTKINGQQMGVAGCKHLRFRVHPYCKRQAGPGLLRSSRKDRKAIKECKVKNKMNTKKTKKNKSKKMKKGKSKKKRSKLKKRKGTKLKIVY